MSKRKERPGAPPLTLPHEHPFSLAMADEATAWAKEPHNEDCIVKSCRVVHPGIVEVTIQAGAPEGFGCRSWNVRIGGMGIGDEPELAAMLNTAPRAVIAVRFTCPYLSLPGVDDAGICDASLLQGLGPQPTLMQVCERVGALLKGSAHLLDVSHEESVECDESQARRSTEWQAAETHTMAKQRVVDSYRAVAKCPQLVSDSVALRPEWLAPAFRHLIGLGKQDAVAACAALMTKACHAGSSVSGGEEQMLQELAPGIYAFDLFTPLFCRLLLEEIDSFEATSLPRRRPNTMNRKRCGGEARVLEGHEPGAIRAPHNACVSCGHFTL